MERLRRLSWLKVAVLLFLMLWVTYGLLVGIHTDTGHFPLGPNALNKGLALDEELKARVKEINTQSSSLDEAKKEIDDQERAGSKGDQSDVSNLIQVDPEVAVYKSRKEQVKKVCQKYGLEGFRKIPDILKDKYESLNPVQKLVQNYTHPLDKSLLHSEHHHLTYCWVHKVASSSWNALFFQFAGLRSSDANLHQAAQKLKPSASELGKAVSDLNLRFLFVRHPFERIVSAFVDKFELGKLTDYIFVVYNPGVFKANPTTMASDKQRPTFREFIKYILSLTKLDQFNDHWIPIWAHCFICTVDYDVIGRLDTLVEDSNYVAKKAHLENFRKVNKLSNTINRRAGSPEPKYSSPIEYFNKELTQQEIRQLYSIYKLDFEMYGYSATEYLKDLP